MAAQEQVQQVQGLTHSGLRFREGGDPKKAKSYLPPNKQFLVTRNGGSCVRGVSPSVIVPVPRRSAAWLEVIRSFKGLLGGCGCLPAAPA